VRATDAPGFKLVGATHQVRNTNTDPPPQGVKILLGLGNGFTPNSDSDAMLVAPSGAYPLGDDRQFDLETTIDRGTGRVQSQLRTHHMTWTRACLFPFPTTIAGMGFGLAMPAGAGTPTVTVNTFSIYRNGPVHKVMLRLFRFAIKFDASRH